MNTAQQEVAGYDRAWGELSEGVGNRKHGFHTFTMATVGANGLPQARTMVLREADGARRVLRFHCDARSPKFAELRERPHVCALFYSEPKRLQVRVTGTVTLHRGDDLCRTIWDAMQPISRDCYRTPFAPSSLRSESNLPLLPLSDAFSHFTAAYIAVETLESLVLSRGGHDRARHEWDAETVRTHLLHP